MSSLQNKIKGIQIFRDKILPAWAKRAKDSPEYHTKKNESVRTSSGHYKEKEILFPRIRMRGPGLEKMSFDKAKKEAIKRKDYIEFDAPKLATAWSKSFSKSLGKKK